MPRETAMLGSWVDRSDELGEEFRTAQPFPMLVIDDFLEAGVADGLLSEFPAIERMPRSNDYVFGDKREDATLAEAGPTCKMLFEFFVSDEFVRMLKAITGRDLFVDASLHGGGFHQGGNGSYLDTHVDFNIHPRHEDWFRVLNILLYLNKDWPPEYGGELLVRRHPSDEPRAISPQFNRCVIMLTSDDTYHGYRKMTLPPGVTRRSIAAYAYERISVGSTPKRTTSWAPENAGLGKRILARYWSQGSVAKEKLQSLRNPRR
jgi:2OG-Fe(II) oxygenase superfamily